MSFTRFRERSRDVQDGTERHVWGEQEYLKSAGSIIKVKGTDSEDQEASVLNIGGVSFNLKKDSDSEVFLLASSSDTTLKVAMMTIPKDKQRRWMEGAGGVQHPTDPEFALDFSDKLAHITKNLFAVGEKGEFEVKGEEMYIRVEKGDHRWRADRQQADQDAGGRQGQRRPAEIRRLEAGRTERQRRSRTIRQWASVHDRQRPVPGPANRPPPGVLDDPDGRLAATTRCAARPASFRAWSTSTTTTRYPDPGPLPPSSGYRTIKNTDWLQSLILNILNTRARTDLKCPSPAGVYGHWSESYRDDGLHIGSRLWNAADKSYARVDDAVKAIQAAVEYDMAKLTVMKVADSVEVEAAYRGKNTVGVVITATVAQAKHVINLSGSFVSGSWVWQ